MWKWLKDQFRDREAIVTTVSFLLGVVGLITGDERFIDPAMGLAVGSPTAFILSRGIRKQGQPSKLTK
jgi:hypothetical protein